jgi:hypothetical protein
VSRAIAPSPSQHPRCAPCRRPSRQCQTDQEWHSEYHAKSKQTGMPQRNVKREKTQKMHENSEGSSQDEGPSTALVPKHPPRLHLSASAVMVRDPLIRQSSTRKHISRFFRPSQCVLYNFPRYPHSVVCATVVKLAGICRTLQNTRRRWTLMQRTRSSLRSFTRSRIHLMRMTSTRSSSRRMRR